MREVVLMIVCDCWLMVCFIFFPPFSSRVTERGIERENKREG